MYWLIFCISACIFLSLAIKRFDAFHAGSDFIPVYTGARCLLHDCNPYEPSQLDQQYFLEGGSVLERPNWANTPPLYPPSTLLALSPLTLFRFPVARLIWVLLNGCLFVTSAAIILFMCPRSHWWLATILVSLILITSGILLALGNPGIFSISLLIMGSYLFLRGRYLPLGALLLVLSLAAKPQMGGLIVLYLLARRIHLRYAVAAMAGALAILLSAGLILSLHPQSADWSSSLKANISAASAPDGVDDPRPVNNKHGHAVALINLQAITAVFLREAREYDAAAYAIFLSLLAVMITAIVRTDAHPDIHLISIGALALLSLMPVYHRFYDTRMLLITIPAAVIVYQKRRLLGTVIGALTLLNVVSVQDRVQKFIVNHQMFQSILSHKFLFILLLRQQNLELPLLFCLYMFAIFTIRFSSVPSMTFPAENPREAFSQ